MLNWIFLALIIMAVTAAAHLGTMSEVTTATATSAKTAVDVAIGLIGQMALWLGMMKILEEAGFLRSLARAMRPVMTRLFPDVPPDHPAMSAMILNLAANVLGLSNAATPFGLRAMIELDKLNPRKGVATNAMCTFLAINASGVAVLPLTVIGLRATLGAKNLTGIVVPTLLATMCSTLAAIVAVKLVQRLPIFAPERYPVIEGAGAQTTEVKGMAEAEKQAQLERPRAGAVHLAIIAAIFASIAWGLVRQYSGKDGVTIFGIVKDLLEGWFLPILMISILMAGFARRVRVYETVISGAKEGFNIAVTIIPFMVAILVAVGMFRASGALGILTRAIDPVTSLVGFPAEAIPMALIRPLSGSGATAVLTDIMKTHGPDSFVGFLSSIINGSFETTFYVIALYYGSIGVRASRHTLIGCLAADLAGVSASLVFARIFY